MQEHEILKSICEAKLSFSDVTIQSTNSYCSLMLSVSLNVLLAFGPQANYTERMAAICRRN
jgi:hypothetical protein